MHTVSCEPTGIDGWEWQYHPRPWLMGPDRHCYTFIEHDDGTFFEVHPGSGFPPLVPWQLLIGLRMKHDIWLDSQRGSR